MRAGCIAALVCAGSVGLVGSALAQAPRVVVYTCPGERTVEVTTLPDGRVSFRTDGPAGVLALEGCQPSAHGASRLRIARVATREGRRVRVEGADLADGQRVAWINPRNGRAVAVGRAVRSTIEEGGGEVTYVELGVGEVVPRDATARPTELRETADPWAPPWHGNVWQVIFGARPFVPVDDAAPGQAPFGFAPWTALRYRARAPFSVSAEVDPLAVTGSVGGTDVAMVFIGMLGIDTRYFEVAAGSGISQHPTVSCCGGGVHALLAERIRLGALDGVHLEVTAVESFERGAMLRLLSGRAQLPLEALGVARDWWLLARGGGGAAGLGFGEVGAKALVVGNGGHLSVFLSVTAGAFGMMARATFDQLVLRVGPSLSAEVEARF